jgi:hypothetical protein
MDKATTTHSGIIQIIHDVELPRIQVTIWDVPGDTAGLWERVREVAKTLRHEERTHPKSGELTYARVCGALAEALESFGKGL